MKKLFTLIAGASLLAGCSHLCGSDVHSCDLKRADFTCPDTLFAFDSDKLTDSAKTHLDKVAQEIKTNNHHAQINGYTDNTGAEIYNVDLSERRAKAVKNYLIEQGVQKSSLTTTGYGAADFVAPNTTKEGRAKNRRTEIIFQ